MKLRFVAAAVMLTFCVGAQAGEAVPMTWTIEGGQRHALVYVPAEANKPVKSPVVFAFHGHGGNMHFAARGMRFQDAWPDAIVVYPQGLPTPSLRLEDRAGNRPGWQHRPGEFGDRDVKFVDAMLATLREKYAVDDNRIYATGFSNGGFFTYLLWAMRPGVFAAFAPGAGLILPGAEPAEVRPLLHFGGRADALVKFTNQEQTIAQARKIDHADSLGKSCGPLCTEYTAKDGGAVVTFIHPGGHFYPPNVTPLIVRFFQEHPRKI